MSVVGRGNSPTDIFFSRLTSFFSNQHFVFPTDKKVFFSNDELFSLFFACPIGPRAFSPRLCRFSVLHYREFRTFRTCPFLAGEILQPTFFFSTDKFFFPTNILFFQPTKKKVFWTDKIFMFQRTPFFPLGPRGLSSALEKFDRKTISLSPQPKYH